MQAVQERRFRIGTETPSDDGGVVSMDWENGHLVSIRKHAVDCTVKADGFRGGPAGRFVCVEFGEGFGAYITPTQARELRQSLLEAADEAEA